METPASVEASRPPSRKKVILISALSAAVAGFLVSYAFLARYTSQSLVIVEGQRMPDSIVQPLITSDFTQRLATVQQQVLATSCLRPMIERMGIVAPEEQRKLIEDIRQNMTVEPVVSDLSRGGAQAAQNEAAVGFPGFYVDYVDSSPRRAQQICNEMTGLLLTENLKLRSSIVEGTVAFLKRQVDDARANLQVLDAQLLVDSKVRDPHSPANEVTHKRLVRDYDDAQKGYSDLLGKLREAKAAEQMENDSMGEQWHVLSPAGLPDVPDFPNRLLFAGGGMGAGLILGIGLALRLK